MAPCPLPRPAAVPPGPWVPHPSSSRFSVPGALGAGSGARSCLGGGPGFDQLTEAVGNGAAVAGWWAGYHAAPAGDGVGHRQASGGRGVLSGAARSHGQ